MIMKYEAIKMERIEIAKIFVCTHKNNNIDEWLPSVPVREDKYLKIYNNLINDVYGDVRCTEEDGITISYEVEIDRTERADGNPYLFTWDITK